MSESVIYIVVGIVAGIGGAFLVVKLMSKKSDSDEGTGVMKLLIEQMSQLNRTVDQKMGESTKTMDSRISEVHRSVTDSIKNQLGASQRLVKEITTELTQVKEAGKNMLAVADRIQDLQDMLKNPKQRGVLGEYYLETLLKNVLPPGSFQMQYGFKDGEIVDAVVFIKEKIIPVDSKFSLENYNRITEEKNDVERKKLEKIFENDLKLRITETAKYIRPQEGTMDFAFMFIPHEAIYYDLLVGKVGQGDNENLIQRAASKYKVIIVSPTSFLAYLQTVLQGLKAMQIEETAKDVVIRVSELGKHLKSYEDYHLKLGNNLNTVVNQYNLSSKELKKVDKDVMRITGSSAGLEPVLIEKPDSD